jgi:hypothetical protein
MVNGKGISRTRFEMEVNRRLAVVRSKNPKELAGSRGGKVKAGTERDVATEMIRRALMEQQAVKLGVALKADAVSQRIESERQKVGADKFEADLKKQGLTTADTSTRSPARCSSTRWARRPPPTSPSRKTTPSRST